MNFNFDVFFLNFIVKQDKKRIMIHSLHYPWFVYLFHNLDLYQILVDLGSLKLSFDRPDARMDLKYLLFVRGIFSPCDLQVFAQIQLDQGSRSRPGVSSQCCCKFPTHVWGQSVLSRKAL